MSRPLELVLLGAGNRGARAYATYAFDHPNEVRFVAVAEPDPIRRQRFAADHDIDDQHCFADWRDLIDRGQLGDAALDHHPGPDARSTGCGRARSGLPRFARKTHGAHT